MPKLSTQEAAHGWTHELVVDYTDINASSPALADNATFTVTHAVPAGATIRHFAREIVTDFTDSGSGAQLNVIVGDGATTNGYLTNFAAHASQTTVQYQADTGGFVDGATANSKTYTAADTIDILFTPGTGAPYSLNELTAGQIKFKWVQAEI